jgi:hypothetical protein
MGVEIFARFPKTVVSFPSGHVLKVCLVNNLGCAESAHHVDAQFVGVVYLRTHAQ